MLLLIIASSLSVCCASATGKSHPSQQMTRSGVVPGNWNAIEALQPGTQVIVTLKNGGRVSGTFKALEPMLLEITAQDDKDSSVARSEVANIMTSSGGDSLVNGALIGAGVGLAAAAIVLATIGSGNGYVLPSAQWGGPLVLSGAGFVLGMVIDRAHRDERLLYKAVPE
jgi:hypothetical protein